MTGQPGVVRRTAAPVAVAAALGAWAGALAIRDPHVSGSWGYCPFLVVTGLPCPFCGGLRAVRELEHADVAAAASSNLLVVIAVPVAFLGLVGWVVRRGRGDGTEPPPGASWPVAVSVLTVALLFGVLRWLPSLAWLNP